MDNDDVLSEIFMRIDLHDVPNCSRVCKSWNELIQDDYTWKLRCMKDFGCADYGSDWRSRYRRLRLGFVIVSDDAVDLEKFACLQAQGYHVTLTQSISGDYNPSVPDEELLPEYAAAAIAMVRERNQHTERFCRYMLQNATRLHRGIVMSLVSFGDFESIFRDIQPYSVEGFELRYEDFQRTVKVHNPTHPIFLHMPLGDSDTFQTVPPAAGEYGCFAGAAPELLGAAVVLATYQLDNDTSAPAVPFMVVRETDGVRVVGLNALFSDVSPALMLRCLRWAAYDL
eukprot:TRINITY_DN657_c0_g1_i1.p1 TRINITY_DN657_c0_g1~~TRINITY_DN657_c0_g1_i1.p1  ORF type:complete len:284 (-),score=39.67 TRINITY_DN657_c0_g1_i1:15-866(-)